MTTLHSDAQREELLVLQRALLSLAKRLGMLICGLIIAGVVVGIADHYKLQSVENTVVELKVKTEAQSGRSDEITVWRAGVDIQLLDLKARIVQIEQLTERQKHD